jgi:hypothetical protein
MEENRLPKIVLCMNLERRQRGRPKIRWQDEVRADGRLVGEKVWGKKRYNNREEWKKLQRTASNHRILQMVMGWVSE